MRFRTATATSLLLAFLVFLSLFQTARLWYFSPYLSSGPAGDYDLKVEKPGIDLEECLRPLAIIAHLEGSQHLEFRPGDPGYDLLWQEALAHLPREDFLTRVSYGEVKQIRQSGPAVEYILPVRLSWRQYRQAWGLEPAGGAEESPAIDRFLLRLSRPTGVYFVDNLQADAHFFEKALLSAEILGQLPKGAGRAVVELPTQFKGISLADGLFVPAGPVLLSGLALAPARMNFEQEARLFFVDPSLARKVEERDGAVFYTDGVGGLRLYPQGDLEYTLPQPAGSSLRLTAALEKAVAFLKSHGGPPEGVLVKEIRPDPNGSGEKTGRTEIALIFLREGLPLLGERFPLELEISEGGVTRFTRIWRFIAGPTPNKRTVFSAESLLSRVAQEEGEARRQIPRLSNIYLAYYLPRLGAPASYLRPVWVLETPTGGRYIYDAWTGAPLGR